MKTKHANETGSLPVESRRYWWKEAIVYQIYPRSFKDSNGDGIGDLPGIISKLDYVQSLGVDVIWLNPIFASPNDDNGYDISDYRDIMKDFGTMKDFDALLQGIHDRGLKLVLDLVVNHTSDEHPWFMEAHKSRKNPYYEYYHWWPAEQGEPPMRPSYFDEEGTAWKYNKATDSYYLHYFSQKQPDLNWENPKVRKEIFDMMRFWFDKGIDGFRMDSISLISKHPNYPEIDTKRYPNLFEFYAKGPQLHAHLREMNREVLSKYDCMSVGEGSAVTAKEVAKFVKPERKELNMLYHFDAAWVRNTTEPDAPDSGIDYSLITLKRMFTEWDREVEDGWPSIYLGNHDQPRMVSRFGSDRPEFREVSAKMLATFLLTMRGTPYWYAGDEIGMTNIRFDNIAQYKDIETISRYKKAQALGEDTEAFLEEQKEISRDNARTPFQWNETVNAGFTTGIPWLPVNSNYKTVNVADEERNPRSVLNYFKKAVDFRQSDKEFIYGSYTLLDALNPRVFCYLRKNEHADYLIALNFSPLKAETAPGMHLGKGKRMLNNYATPNQLDSDKVLTLRPFEAIVIRFEKS